jgi:hypothetical protein
MNAMEVRADCAAKDLLPPGDIEIHALTRRVGGIPGFWKPKVLSANVKFRRWLRDLGVLKLWVRDVVTERAVGLLYKIAMRKDFETVVLVHGDVGRAHSELLIKYPEELVPNEAVLARYQEFFWDVGSMGPEEIYQYLSVIQDREELLPALQGDLARTYGTLGLQQRIKGEVFLQNVVEAANRQALRMKSTDAHSGSALAGMSAAIRVGIDALDRLEDRHSVNEGDTGLRQDAADFVARVVQADAVPSIDELDRRHVIDAEPVAAAAGAGNVFAITNRRSD